MAKTTNTKNSLDDFKLGFEELPSKKELARRKRELLVPKPITIITKPKRKKPSLFSRLKKRIGAFIWV